MKLRILFAASSGGHLEQIMYLKPLMEKYDSVLLTEKTQYELETSFIKKVHLKQVNRKEKMYIIYMIYNIWISLKIFIKERPNIVISTGALATIPICFIAKLFNKKIIFIESFAKINSPTLTGRLMYKIADQFYVQWESMLEHYPNAIFKGGGIY